MSSLNHSTHEYVDTGCQYNTSEIDTHSHSHVHTNTQKYKHTAHTYIYTRTHTHTYAYSLALTLTHAHPRRHARRHACRHARERCTDCVNMMHLCAVECDVDSHSCWLRTPAGL